MMSRANPRSVAVALELLPHVRAPGMVVAEHVEVGERVAEEVPAVDPPLDRRRLVLVAHHRQDDGKVGVDREARRDARLRLDDRVVLVDPLLGVLRLDEGEGQRADALLGGQLDRVAPRAGDPQRRVRLLDGLGDHVAGGHLDEAPVPPGEGLLDEHPRDHVERLVPLLALGLAVDAEAAELGARGGLAGAELAATLRHEVEHRHLLGHARGMLVAGRDGHDPEPQADAIRALAGRGEEDLGRRRVGVLLEEVVLDLPDVVDAQAVRQLDLVERVGDQLLLGPAVPRAGELVLVEDPEAHRRHDIVVGGTGVAARIAALDWPHARCDRGGGVHPRAGAGPRGGRPGAARREHPAPGPERVRLDSGTGRRDGLAAPLRPAPAVHRLPLEARDLQPARGRRRSRTPG